MDGYNYERFDVYVESGREAEEFDGFPRAPHARDQAPDGNPWTLDGPRVLLSDLWSAQGLVLEFGSFT